MSAISVIKPSFSAGELSPLLQGRVDLAKHQTGVRTMRNFFVHPQGGASNRPGTRFVGEVQDSTVRHRLVPFQFRSLPAGQAYVLVFGPLTMQVAMMGEDGPGFVESAPGVRFTLATPYEAADLARLKYVQSADTMTLTHPAHAPRTLTRSGHAAWQLTPITFAPRTAAPAGLAAAAGGAAAFIQVTAISDATGEESLPGPSAGASSATAGSWSWGAVAGCSTYNVYKKKGSIHGFAAQVTATGWTDDNVAPDIGVTPPQQRNPFGAGFATGVTVSAGGAGYSTPSGKLFDGGQLVSTVAFSVSGGAITGGTLAAPGQKISSNAWIAITDGAGSGAVLQPVFGEDPPGGGGPTVILAVVVVNGGAGYHAGAQVHSLYYGSILDYGGYVFTPTISGGAIVSVAVTTRGSGDWVNPADQAQLGFTVDDSSGSGAVVTPAIAPDSNSFPQCSTYYQQRQVFAGTTGQPQTLWFSNAGAFNNMAVSQPTRDSDAITRALTGRQVNEIRHLVPVGTSLLAMTSGAEWRCWPGPSAPALTPSSCATLPQTGFGTSHVPPLQADNAVLFVQERGSRVRELRFDVLQDQYQASDLSVLSSHLLDDTGAAHAIEEWALCEEPFRIVWAVRSDGTLLGFTWMREHEVQAWHRHDTDGSVESVASIVESEPASGGGAAPPGDALYLIVRRTVNGATKRYLERLAPRRFATLADAWFLDCALAYDGPATTLLTGLEHLEGKAVTVLADGAVRGPFAVSGGAVTLPLPLPCTKAIAGLAYSACIETLDLDLPGAGGTAQGRLKKISRLTVRVKDSCGLAGGVDAAALRTIGGDGGGGDGSGGYGSTGFTGDWSVTLPPDWTRAGRLVLRQDRPLPCTVLAVIPDVTVGG